MYIVTDQVCKWRQRKHKKHMVSMFSRCLIMAPLVLIGTVGIALAAPSGGVITGGSGGIETSGSATNISQTSPRLDINWNTFSTDVHESINFAQPTSEAIALNRVIGGVPSELRGALNANGRVFILNDSGITFFATSQVNVGALLATTAMNLSTDGGSFSFSGPGYGTVLNDGSIHVSDGGFAVLAAPYVANTGFIQANLGTIELASANDFTVDFRGDGLIGFTISKSTLDGIVEAGKALGVDNTGTLLAGSGAIGISAGAASSIVQSVVNLDGIVDASSFGVGADGGTVLVASVGDINIGGEVRADGGVSGNGGTVTTWADGTNRFESGAVITARGGDVSGDGGFIEVSGNDVRVRGTANASALNGAAGTFLIDPWALTIADGAGTDSTATVFEQNIENTSQLGTNVDLVADNSITMENLADDELTGGNGAISMSIASPYCSDCAITFDDLNDKIATTSGAIAMTALDGSGEGGPGPGTIRVGHLETLRTGADITLTAGLGGIVTGNLCAGGTADACGVARTNNPGDITLSTTGSIETLDVTIYAEDTDSASAYLTMTAGGDITTGNISLTAIDPFWSHDNATAIANLTAGGSVAMESASVIAEGEKSVTAELNVTATAGDITVTPLLPAAAINVNATALDGGGSDSAVADAAVSLIAGNDITINGGVEVNADAMNTGHSASADSDDDATASLDVSAVNDVDITGNVTVHALSTLDGSALDSAVADADADIYGNNITVNGDITVEAVAVNSAAVPVEGYCYDYYCGSGAEASADLYMSTGGEGGGDITINGNTLVTASAMFEGAATDSADADASASAEIYAGHDVTVNGDLTVTAVAVNNGTDYASDASADADLDVNAGNDINITGDVLVKADATLGAGGTDSADADASADLYAGNYVNIRGDLTVSAGAVNNGTDYANTPDDASADADLYVNAGNDINITGDVLVKADETCASCSDSASASAYVDISADNDVNIRGDLTVTAVAVNNGTDYASSVIADAELYVNAGNDLNITGDILVTADMIYAASWIEGDASANAIADLSAGHDITILTDPITVAAHAVNKSSSSATAYAALRIEAGTAGSSGEYCYGECTPASGSIYITGDILATANADSAYGSSYEQASASVYLKAPDAITIRGADPKAYAPSADDPNHALVQGRESGCDGYGCDGGEGQYHAELTIEAAIVDIEPKAHDDEHEVISSLEANRVELIEPLGPGKDPLSFDADGLVSWATGAGVTSPSGGFMVTPDAEGAIARGVDPTTILPAPAAGGMGLSSGLDAYSVGGPDYCDQVVNGYCLPAEGGKKPE